MWGESENYLFGSRISETDRIIRNASMQMMKTIADEINSYVNEKEDERNQDDSQSCKCDGDLTDNTCIAR